MTRDRALWTLAALALLMPVGGVAGQQPVDPRWQPWLGCWQPIEDAVADFSEGAAARQAYYCVRPAAGGVEISTVVDGAAISSRTMIADGARYPVAEEGCTGWQSAQWSADGQRLFVSSEVLCEGGVKRTASGLMAMVAPTEWIDAHAIGMGDERAPRSVRYRPAPLSVAEQAGFELPLTRFGMPADARRLAAAPLSIEDVEEAARNVDGQALEMFLFERGEGFELNASRIERLADAGVSSPVIDLMVALSYPGRFRLDREAMTGEFVADEARPEPDRYSAGYYGRDRYWDYCYGRGFYSYCSPYGYMPLGWSYGYSNPYMWGGYGGWGYNRPVIVVEPGDGAGSPGGRAVKGQGYTRTNRGSASGGGSTGRSTTSSGATSRTGGSAGGSSVGGASGGSSTGSAAGSTGSSSGGGGRTAVRRGGGK